MADSLRLIYLAELRSLIGNGMVRQQRKPKHMILHSYQPLKGISQVGIILNTHVGIMFRIFIILPGLVPPGKADNPRPAECGKVCQRTFSPLRRSPLVLPEVTQNSSRTMGLLVLSDSSRGQTSSIKSRNNGHSLVLGFCTPYTLTPSRMRFRQENFGYDTSYEKSKSMQSIFRPVVHTRRDLLVLRHLLHQSLPYDQDKRHDLFDLQAVCLLPEILYLCLVVNPKLKVVLSLLQASCWVRH